MTETQVQIERLRTLQESYDELADKAGAIPDLKNIYSVRFEKNNDNVNTYTMVLPLVAGIEGRVIIL